MILYDFGSLIHRSVYSAIKAVNPHKKEGKYITDEYIAIAIYKILNEVIESYIKYSKEYGKIILCIDDYSKEYWRKEIYPDYKRQRQKNREESEIIWSEVYSHIRVLNKIIEEFTPFKAIRVARAEADDIIGVLTRKFALFEKILILSPDKDFKQLHKFGNVFQYSHLTNNWVHNDEEDFEIYHPLLGDACDNVPKVTDFSVFSKNFKEYLKKKNLNLDEFNYLKLNKSEKEKILEDFNIYKKNKHNEDTELDVYDNPRLGISTINRKIKQFGSLDKFIDSNPIYRYNYELNKKLVLDVEIPVKIEVEILNQFNNAEINFDMDKLEKYLLHYKLHANIEQFRNLSRDFSYNVELTTENCGW